MELFLEFARAFGLPVAVFLIVTVVLGQTIVTLWQSSNQSQEARIKRESDHVDRLVPMVETLAEQVKTMAGSQSDQTAMLRDIASDLRVLMERQHGGRR